MTSISLPAPGLRRELAASLAAARRRTELLVAPVDDADLRRQHDPLMSPILWDLGHIAHFEELWLTQNVDGPIEFTEMPGLYNPFEHPRRERGALPIPGRDDMLALLADIRRRTAERLDAADFSANALAAEGYVWRMVAQHEEQHQETILQTLQLKQGNPYTPAERYPVPEPSPAWRLEPGAMVRVPGGTYTLGTDDRSAAYDNERPRHAVALRDYFIDVTPVTNAQYAEFIDAGGYRERRWWSDAGWRWLDDARAESPKHWEHRDGGWWRRQMDQLAPVDPRHPVCHVCWYEAEAFARWAGKRLPTEADWEVAATWDPAIGATRAYPWGDAPVDCTRANVDQLAFGTTPVGAYPDNVSPLGCYGMIGDVWEWTASDFGGYPGFEAFPYAEYSEAFFGAEYKVLRGGSWATRPGVARATFRNWDYPIRRQIFSGFRCARDD
jgi:iron(II)-dependent oxidoreductase